MITLNVGGTLFTTTVATLIKYPDSMLAAMFNPESERPPAQKDSSGNYFIDRDPEPFRVILCFLRNARLPEDIVGCSLEQVGWEAIYFGLKELMRITGERKRAKEEEEMKQREAPKISPLEYEERALKLRHLKGVGWDLPSINNARKLVGKYEFKAVGLRRLGYED